MVFWLPSSETVLILGVFGNDVSHLAGLFYRDKES